VSLGFCSILGGFGLFSGNFAVFGVGIILFVVFCGL